MSPDPAVGMTVYGPSDAVEVVVAAYALPSGNGTADASGWLRAWARDESGAWRALVEWADVRGLKHGSWFPAAALRQAAEPNEP